MKYAWLLVSIVAIATSAGLAPAHADSTEAMCQVRKDGETKHGPSGPCTFSQRQGYIDIDLRNGEIYSLSPGKQPHHFKDQKGHKVVRTHAQGDTQEFKWEGGTKVIVTFGASSSSGRDMPGTPKGLQDLAHDHRVGGEIDDETTRRGWRQAKNEVQGDEVYSYWSKGSHCIVVHFDARRHVASIANAFESSCR